MYETKDKDSENLDCVLDIVNLRLCQIDYSPLTNIETEILKGIWQDRTYEQIAAGKNYSNNYVTNIAAPSLLKKLSCLVNMKIGKKNCRKLLEKHCLLMEEEKPLYPSGAISVGSRYYVKRYDAEQTIYAEVEKPGALVRIKGPKEMGKTSLLLRLIARAKQLGYQTVYFNLHELDREIFEDHNRFLRYFCTNIVRELGFETKLDEYWDEEIGCKASCNSYFQNCLLRAVDSPLLLALDEVDRVFEHPKIAKEFFSLLRLWHEKAKINQMWQKLRLAICHSTEIYVPLQLKQSPFNVGLPVQLGYLSWQEVVELAKCYGFNSLDGEEANLLMGMVGGHPALVHLAVYHLSQGNITLKELLKTAPTSTGIYANHLNRHQERLYEDPELAIAFSKVLNATKPVAIEPRQAYRLHSMGLIKLSENQAVVSCRLYGYYFRQTLREMSDRSQATI